MKKETKKAELEKLAPSLMAELTKEFIGATDLNARAKIRARMKAVLDFASVDTSYPDHADKKQPNNVGQFGDFIGAPGYDMPAQPLMIGHGGVLPIVGADNTI